ncbi:Na+/melibiose symporter [Enhydrobacter aerosaccus]|uniref:Na+/melibiose symporter n=1 Tax=Enhydrobacter aerosaccus TaxID=225324 RepID=A0A1T4S2F3_9HYPH|nr:MFS transporter [Enhydrobacter aerosaccus]SKA22347.1 Na+/melibiose symporter [Enhydrobacter aerosaccus]
MHAGPTGTGTAGSAKIKFERLVAYSTLQLPLAMAALPVVLNVSHFYGELLKVPLELMGAIFIFARIVDAVQDPVIGLISDRFTHRGPRGRLTFVALMIPVLAAGFLMLFAPPQAWHERQTVMAIWLIAALLLVHLGYSGVSISYHSHGAELTDDYNERTKVTVGREVFGLLGMTIAVVMPTALTALLGEGRGYMLLGLLFIPVVILFAAPTLLGSGPSVHPPVVHGNRSPFFAFFAPLKNRLFRRLLLIFIVNGSALGVAVTVMLFYVEHVLQGTKLQAGIILLVYFVTGAASVPMWLLLSRRISKMAAWFVGMLLTAVAMGLAIFIGPGDFYWFLGISVITGIGLGADYGLPPSILADIINAPEGGETRGKTGTYFGLWALATKLATAIGAAGSLPVSALLGFDPARGRYGTFALVVVYVVVPVVIKIAAALLAWFIHVEPDRGSVREEFRRKA